MKNTRKPTRILATSAAALLALCALPAASHAANKIWADNGNPTNTWTTGTNWQGGAAPVATDNLEFSFHFSGSGTRTATNNYVATSFGTILFQGQKFILDGNALTLTGGITNNSTNIQTLSFGTTGITLGASQTWASNTGALVLNGAVALNGFQMQANADASGHNVTIAGIVSGVGPAGFAGILVGNGATVGNLRLTNGANSYTAGAGGFGTELNNGTLTVSATHALGNVSARLLIGNAPNLGTRTLASDAAGVTGSREMADFIRNEVINDLRAT